MTVGESSAASPAAFDPRLSALDCRNGSDEAAVPDERLQPDWLRARLASPPVWTPEMTGDRIRLRQGPPRPAAVLVPIVLHQAAPTVLLTQRTGHLREHSGQVAFPGGRFEPSDGSPTRTALREAEEEIGLEPSRVEILGSLPDYLTGTGFRVTPIIGLVRPGQALRPDPNEVADVFEVPLRFLMNPRHHQRRLVEVSGSHRVFWAMPWRPEPHRDEYFIWGATAGMLRSLYRLLSA
jgi:8-oxo-dGTP pyrophosphatase MutT (NUDIX family)